MRKTVQALSLLLFTAFFALATYRLPDGFPADLYLRIDPLLGLNALLASREMIGRVLWSLILIGATLTVGRFFCAYVCPLGAAIDGFDFLFFRKVRRAVLRTDSTLRRWKYVLLILFFAAAATGVSLVYLVDPIALLTRFYTFLLYPLLITIINILLDLLR
ncbi:MAG: 4Fe-4S binding protein, partial [Syntrophales bacterium]|nr:4Fe-4S binding protein [Syntrophales bacterium]